MTRALVRLALTICAVGALVWVLYLPGALTPALGAPGLIPADCTDRPECASYIAPEPQAPVVGSPVTAG